MDPHPGLYSTTISRLYLAVKLLRRLVAGLSSQRPGFMPVSVHVGFVVDKMALGQVYLPTSLVPPVSIIPSVLNTHISSRELATGPVEVTVQTQSHPIDMNNMKKAEANNNWTSHE
jgi:hypothetical protein